MSWEETLLEVTSWEEETLLWEERHHGSRLRRGDIVGRRDVVGGDIVGGLVMRGDFLGGATLWEERCRGRKDIMRGDIIGRGNIVVGGDMMSWEEETLLWENETSWEETL